jgi:hypothetical protein
MIHDRNASTLNLARVVRDGLDERSPETKIPTATLRLLLDLLLELGEPSRQRELNKAASHTINAKTAEVSTVWKQQQDQNFHEAEVDIGRIEATRRAG